MALTLQDRIRVVAIPHPGTFGVRFHARIEGWVVAGGRNAEGLVERAVARLEAAGVDESTPAWAIDEMIRRHEQPRSRPA